MNLKLSLIFLVALMNGCASGPTAPTVDHVESQLAAVPSRVSPGLPVPDYSGVWVGTRSSVNCRAVFRESCKFAPETTTVVRFEITQSGSDVSINSTWRGYITSDLGMFCSTQPLQGYVSSLYLQPAGDELKGIHVEDAYDGSRVTRTVWWDYTGLRRQQ